MSNQLKLIKHNMGRINLPDDPAFGPWLLEASFSVPGFMAVAAALIYGSERLAVRGKTKEALEEFVSKNRFDKHPRLIRLEITEPEKGKVTGRPVIANPTHTLTEVQPAKLEGAAKTAHCMLNAPVNATFPRRED